MDGWMDTKQIDGCMDSKKNYEKIDGWLDGWIYKYMDVWMARKKWMVGWMDIKRYI